MGHSVCHMDGRKSMSNYFFLAFTEAIGYRFNAKKIERLFFTKDLLLNAEYEYGPALVMCLDMLMNCIDGMPKICPLRERFIFTATRVRRAAVVISLYILLTLV